MVLVIVLYGGKKEFKLQEVFMPSNDREILKDISLPYVNRYSCLLSSLVNCYTSIKYEINTGIY